MNKKISLSEKIISRLNAGENFESILNTLRADEKIKAQEISDWWEFMEAQKLDIKPSKSAFKNTLNQTLLLSNIKESDDEVTGWGNFFRSFYFKTFSALSLSFLLIFGISQEFLGDFIKFEKTKDLIEENKNPQSPSKNIKTKIKKLAFNSQNTDFTKILQDIEVPVEPTIVLDNLDLDDQFVKDLERDFKADMDDFYQTKKSLEFLYEETLFKNENQKDISKLYKKIKTPILAKDNKNVYL